MNLLGISWGMGARDVGMKAAVTGAQSNLDKLNDSMDQQSKIAGKSKGPGFWAKMKEGVRNFNIASIASDVHALTGDTGNLSNSLESMAVANAKAAKPFVASLNLTGKEMRRMTSRISGMAIGMNVGAESVAEVFKAVHQAAGPAKDALDALGYSERDWVKISETTGIKVSELTDVMGGMGALWKATAPEEAAFIDRLVEIGKKAGLGLQPIKSLKENIETLGKPFEKLPPELQRSGKEMMGLAESATRMGGVFRELGSSEEEATNLGMQTASMFGEQAVAIERAQKYGLNALDESPLFKWLTSLGVGYSEATNIIETGSRDAVKGTQLIQDQFKRFGMGGAQQQAMLAELSGALGESASGLGYLVQNTDAGTKALARMSAMTVTGKDGLRKYANAAFSSGRTLQESFDLAKEGFDTQIRSISRADVVGLVQGKMGAFREVGKEMKALAKEDGPIGMLVRGMSTFKQLGIQGVFLQIGKSMGMNVNAAQKMSVKFNLVFDTIKGLGEELGPVMNLLGQFGPMGIAAGGIIGFFMLSSEERSAIWKTIEPIWELAKKAVGDIWYGTKIDENGELSGGLKDSLIAGWTTFKGWLLETGLPMVGSALDTIGTMVGDKIKEVFNSALTEGVSTEPIVAKMAVDIIYDKAIGSAAGPYEKFAAQVNRAFAAANMEKWRKQVEGLEDGIYGHYDKDFKGSALGAVENWMTGVQNKWYAIGGTMMQQDLFTPMIVQMKKFKDGWKENIDDPISSGKTSVTDWGASVGNAFTLGVKSVTDWGTSIGGTFANAIAHPREFGQALRGQFDESVTSIASAKQSISDWGLSVGAAFASGKQSVTDWGLSVGTALSTGTQSISDWGLSIGTALFEKFSVENMKAGIQTYIITPFKEAVKGIPDALTSMFDGLGDFFANLDPMKLAKPIAEFFTRAWEKVKGLAGGAADVLGKVMSWGIGVGEGVSEFGKGFAEGPTAAPGGISVATPAVSPANSKTAGLNIGTEFAAGLDESRPLVETAAQGVSQVASDNLIPHSPIPEGPLEGVGKGGPGDPAYDAGMTLMMSFASGIDASALLVADAVTQVLDDSVFATFDAYKTKMDDLAKKKPMLMGIADAMVQSFAGSIENVEIEGKTENVKENIKAMLSIPGLAGVVAAVISEGSKSRAILDKIRDNTQKIAESDLVAKGKSGSSTYTLGG